MVMNLSGCTLYELDWMHDISYVRTKIFQRKPFHSVDAELRARLHNGKPSRHCRERTCQFVSRQLGILLIPFARRHRLPLSIFKATPRYLRKYCLLPLLPPLSSIISTSPGFNCSIEGTWLASTPISPDSAGILTCTLRKPHESAQALIYVAGVDS